MDDLAKNEGLSAFFGSFMRLANILCKILSQLWISCEFCAPEKCCVWRTRAAKQARLKVVSRHFRFAQTLASRDS
ncbi:MAG: hypothetical protein Q7T25_14565 [Sideroxyarcus sp.]|nr:hypothetical protein [Sideroxyarcus sp.]